MKLGRGKYRQSVVPRGGRVDWIGCIPPRYRAGLAWRSLARARRFRLQSRRKALRPQDDRHIRDSALARLEAVLLLAKEPLNTRKLGQYANLADGTQARTLVDRLNQLYDRAGRAFRVQEVAGGLQLLTRPQFSSWLRRLEHIPAEMRLSAPAMETLAVVAYRQPVVRTEIEAVRGVGCGEILRQLLERDLIRVAGRSDELGRPYVYGTTKRFLQLFGLRSVEELPRADVFRSVDIPVPDGAQQAQTRPRALE